VVILEILGGVAGVGRLKGCTFHGDCVNVFYA